MNRKYILKENNALRSFSDVKYAILYKGEISYKVLDEEEFEIVSLCDGKHSFSDEEKESKAFQMLLKRGYIRDANEEDKLNDWQVFKYCNNHHWPIIDLRLTERCNYNCPHCFNASDVNTNNDEWSYEEFLKLLDEAEECGIVGFSFTGGEPMLHPHFLDFVKELYKRNMFLRRLMTNAKFITQELLDEFKAIGCEPHFQISFDGVGTHDMMRGCKGAEEVTLKAIKLCIDNGFDVLVNTQVNKLTADYILNTADVLDSVGVKYIRLIRTTETPRWIKLKGDATLSAKEYYEFCFNFLKEYTKKNHYMSISCWKLGRFNAKDKSYIFDACACNERLYNDNLYLCTTCSQEICIGANGNIYPCHQVSGHADTKGVLYGNAKTQGLQDAINSELYRHDTLITSGDLRKNSKECSSCKYFYQCLGGCRMISKFVLGDLYKASPLSCTFYEEGFEKKVAEILPGWTNRNPSMVD